MKKNWIRYIDCMDKNKGLPSLKNKSIDLCLTDPPYNVKYKANRTKTKTILPYEDNNKDYFNWCISWFEELERICNTIIFTPGNVNLYDWYNYKRPVNLGFWYKKNSMTRATAAHFSCYDGILFYGKFSKKKKLNFLVLEHTVQLTKYIHPVPKNFNVWFDILNQFKPDSVIDPFMGSGTTAEACIRLGIPYYGYEKEIIYKQDIDLRIKKSNIFINQKDNTKSLF